uniref:Transmembrane protein 135 N-terminal domain-containing protein n=1 Tax=Lotharella oceanica TaxID=641309 RepID=A0A7S2XH57_9EUKA
MNMQQPCQCTLHPGMSCTEHFLRAWLFRSSVESAKFYFRIHVLSAILRLNQIYKGPMSFIASKLMTFGKSVLFLSTYAASSMYSTCLIRNAIKSDIPLTSIISGFVAGSSIMLEDRKRRKELTLYVLPRSWEILVNAYLKYIGGENSFISRYSTAINIFAFQCAMAILMYLIHREGFRGLNSLNHGLITAIWGVTPPSRPKRKKKKKRMAEGEKVEEDDKRTTTATLPVSIRKNEDENISVEYNHPSTQKPQPQLEENNLDHACSTDNKKGPNVVSPPHVVRSIQN